MTESEVKALEVKVQSLNPPRLIQKGLGPQTKQEEIKREKRDAKRALGSSRKLSKIHEKGIE